MTQRGYFSKLDILKMSKNKFFKNYFQGFFSRVIFKGHFPDYEIQSIFFEDIIFLA